VTAPSTMQMEEATFCGGIAIKQLVLIKRTHLFCIEVPENEMALLNCGLRGAVRGEGDNLTSMFFNETSHNNTGMVMSGRLFVNSNIQTIRGGRMNE